MNRWRLAAPKRERPPPVYAREPATYRCGDAFLTIRTLPPYPLQRIGQRLAAEAMRLLLRKLAYDEVRLLLSGARSTESYT